MLYICHNHLIVNAFDMKTKTLLSNVTHSCLFMLSCRHL